ncbi:MAG: acyl-CoA thioesterase [Opitutales bacterium]|jgi:acyl-CoA thioester hydrolase
MTLPRNPLVIERRIAFSQTDAAGLVHFTTYFTLMEEAEAELFRNLGLTLLETGNEQTFGFPRVNCQCRFRRPIGFDDTVRIELTIAELSHNRIQYQFVFTGPDGKTCATGTMTTAAATRTGDGNLQGAEIPPAMVETIKKWKNQGHEL